MTAAGALQRAEFEIDFVRIRRSTNVFANDVDKATASRTTRRPRTRRRRGDGDSRHWQTLVVQMAAHSPLLGGRSPATLFVDFSRSCSPSLFDTGRYEIIGLPQAKAADWLGLSPIHDRAVINVVDVQHLDEGYSGMGWVPTQISSPRLRQSFPREVNTPSFTFPLSPLAPDSAFPSPALPFISPQAAALPRKPTRKKSSAQRYAHSQAFWLVLYFAFNLGLTLYNKGVLVRFPFPYTLTAVHALCGSIGSYVLRRRRFYVPAKLDTSSKISLAAFSVVYAVNIAVSNHSLQLVTVPVCPILVRVFSSN